MKGVIDLKKTAILVFALIVLLFGATALYRNLGTQTAQTTAPVETDSPANTKAPVETQAPAETPTPEAKSDPAPDFTMLDAQGVSVKLSDHLGTPVVLNFWASWCGPCQREMPEFDAAAAEYAGKVDFMMVDLTDGGRETVESAVKFIAEQGYSFPVYFDTLYEGADAYAVRAIPVTYFIDAEGNILAYHAGGIDADTLAQGIELILG